MRTLLLAAKFIAIQERQKFISIDHVKVAWHCLEPIDTDLDQHLLNIIRSQMSQIQLVNDYLLAKYQQRLTLSDLNSASEHERILFDSGVKEFIEKLPAPLNQGGRGPDLFRVSSGTSAFRSQLNHLQGIKDALLTEVFGQDDVIESLIDTLAKNAWHKDGSKPAGCFLFLGPPACGKSYLAERFAHHIRDGYHYKFIDMAQYTSHNEAFGLVGAKKTYSDSAPGALTQFVKAHPKSIIVFDEFEKAHTQVLQSLLQMFSTGYLEDQYTNDRVNFTDTILIFASNLGKSLYSNQEFLKMVNANSTQAQSLILGNLANETKIQSEHTVKAIPPELLSRLAQGNVLLFNQLKLADLHNIAERQLRKDFSRFSSSSGVTMPKVDSKLIKLLLLRFAPQFDIREIKAHISSQLIDPVTDSLRCSDTDPIKQVEVDYHDQVSEFIDTKFNQDLKASLTARHQMVRLDTDITERQHHLVFTFRELQLEHLIFASDVGLAGGLSASFPQVTFSSIAGHKHIKQRMQETVNILNQRRKLAASNVTPPAGMLLFGPPGTGKTMLAKAFANQAQLPFISCNGAELLEKGFVERLFERARKYAPSIVFIDEIDALPKRGSAGPLADAIVNRLLTEVDGFKTTEQGIFVIAATNHRHKIDSALTRSGRLDLCFNVPSLDKGARRWFIDKILARGEYAPDINKEHLLLLTAGFSGADLEKIHREAMLRQIREGHESISEALLIDEINTLKFGSRRTEQGLEAKLNATAIHEAGHAVLSTLLMPNRVIEQVTVTPRANSLGRVSFDQDQDIDETRENLFSLTCVALAGREAQVKKFGEAGLDSGASADLKMAMHCAWLANGKLGMGTETENMDIVALQEWSQLPVFQQHLENQIRQWIERASSDTRNLVNQHWKAIETVSNTLLDQEIISGPELAAIIAGTSAQQT